MLNLFTIKDNKVGITGGDAIRGIFLGFFAVIFAQIGALLMTTFLLKREIKDLENQASATEGTPDMRKPFIDRVLRKYYGRSWEQLLTMQLRTEVHSWLNKVLKYSLEIKQGMNEKTANDKLYCELVIETSKKLETNSSTALSSYYWRYLLNKSFPWLWSPWHGYDKTNDGRIVSIVDEKQAEEQFKAYLKEIEPKMYDSDNLFEIEQTWYFDNHKSMINSVLKELFVEHPEYKSVCPAKIC